VFEQNAERATGQAGDIVLFDSRLWHAAAPNQSTRIRRALTLTFTPPFMKPQFDYPRALGYSEGAQFNPALRAVLGYDSRIPASLEEWYQPPDARFYKQGQG
jgi:ectoine hydroxylase-related dioxygenase (phytanoyl-CoA dioxygenase family)